MTVQLRDQLINCIHDHHLVLLVQCAATWFPEGPWDDVRRIEQAIVDLQMKDWPDRRQLVRVIPYDLPVGAGCLDVTKFSDWSTIACLTATLPTTLDIKVFLSTRLGQGGPVDGVATDAEAERILGEMKPFLIDPSPADWDALTQAGDHDAYWDGTGGYHDAD